MSSIRRMWWVPRQRGETSLCRQLWINVSSFFHPATHTYTHTCTRTHTFSVEQLSSITSLLLAASASMFVFGPGTPQTLHIRTCITLLSGPHEENDVNDMSVCCRETQLNPNPVPQSPPPSPKALNCQRSMNINNAYCLCKPSAFALKMKLIVLP